MIIGHERQIKYFNQVLKKGRLAHAYLFYGPEGIGKLTFAKSIAKAIFCEKQPQNIEDVCGVCAQCRQIDAEAHQSVIFLDTERTLVSKKDARKDIPIEDIRELKRLFSLGATGNKWRIAIINEAETMSPAAANAFLKLLEEPGGQTLFFLITSARESLLSTIVSRTQPVRFSQVPQAILKEYIKSHGVTEPAEILDFASGRPGRLIKLLKDKDGLERERKFARSFKSVMQGGMPEVFRFTEKVASDESMRRKTAEYIIRHLRDVMVTTATSEPVSRIKKAHRVASLLETTNVNPRLALDVMFLEAKT